MRFLHLADVFLGCGNSYLSEKARERGEDFRASFRDAVEYALNPRHRIDAVLIAGNLFETHRPDEETWNFARGLISRLLAKDLIVAIVPGHHDSFAYKQSVWRTERLPGVDLLLNTEPAQPVVHDVRGRRLFLYGLAYVPNQTPVPLPAFRRVEEKGVHVALLHGRPAGEPGGESPHRLTLDLPAIAGAGFDLLALGGVRRFREETYGSTTAVYPGSLEGRGFEAEETGEKGPVVVEIDEDGRVHLERVISNRKSIDTVRIDLADERITDAGALENAIATLSGRNRIVEVVLTGTAEFLADLDDIRDDLADDFHHLEIRDESRIVDSGLLRKIESENTIRGYFVRKLGEKLEALRSRVEKGGRTPELLRELEIHEKAMKIGVEQFVEEETPADSIYSLIPDDGETVGAEDLRSSLGVGRLEDKVRAMLEHRRQKSRENAASEGEEAAAENGEERS